MHRSRRRLRTEDQKPDPRWRVQARCQVAQSASPLVVVSLARIWPHYTAQRVQPLHTANDGFHAIFTGPVSDRTTVAPSPARRQAPAGSPPHRSGPRNARRPAGHPPSNAAARSSPASPSRYAAASTAAIASTYSTPLTFSPRWYTPHVTASTSSALGSSPSAFQRMLHNRVVLVAEIL